MNPNGTENTLIAIGCNQGDCRKNIEHAVAAINQLAGTAVIKTSRLLETQPVGYSLSGCFLNGALLVSTTRSPENLMESLLEIEAAAGRNRDAASQNRPVDLDILLYGQQIVDTHRLRVPHPRMTFRRFVLEPACDIAADLVHPVAGVTLGALLHRINHERNVIAVEVPAEFPLSGIAMPDNDELRFVTAVDSAELLRSLRQQVSINQGWLAVIGTTKQLQQLRGAIKLLIRVNLPGWSCLDQDHFSGPCWNLEVCSADTPVTVIRAAVETAVQSLRSLD